jgi:hypothetical protein
LKSLFGVPPADGSPEPPPPHPLRQKIKDGIAAFSLANLCFVTAWYTPLLDTELNYFKKLPLTQATLLGLVLNILWLTCLVWLVIRAMRRWRNRWFHATCQWLLILLWLLPLDFCRQILFRLNEHQVAAFLRRPAGALLVLLLLLGVVWQRRRVARTLAVVTAIMSPLAFITLTRIALLSFGPHHPAHYFAEPPLAPLSPVRPGQPRVVWMIFDETDQRLAFEQRPAGLQLPEFDHLRSESLYATNAYPPGTNTSESLPGLISGRHIASAGPKNASELALTLADTGKVVGWSTLPSVFDSARDLGVNTALVGWFHPYRRILARGLNFCTWYPYGMYQQVRAVTLGKAMRNEIRCLSWNLHGRKLHIELCRDVMKDSLSVVTNATYGLVFLHLPAPHKPWVFDASTRRFTISPFSKGTGYFSNLMLADIMFGELRHAMEASGQWDKTWVIVSADHNWRESAGFDGQVDQRVPFLIKPPGPSQPIIFSPEINTVLTHDLVLAILRGELTNQPQAVCWIEEHPCVQPRAAGASRSR